MILYRQNPFNCKLSNVMLLDAGPEENDGVIYVSKNTYDQCVCLYERFEGERGVPCKLMGVAYGDNITSEFFEHAPEPINMLAPFLGMLAAKHEIEDKNWEQMYGYLHMLSQIVNFKGWLQLPAEARADITISRIVIKTYKESWNDLVQSLTDLVSYAPEVTESSSKSSKRDMVEDNANEDSEEDVDVETMRSQDEFSVDDLDALLKQCQAQAEADLAAKENSTPTSAPAFVPPSVNVPMSNNGFGTSSLLDSSAQEEQNNSAACDAIADMYADCM